MITPCPRFADLSRAARARARRRGEHGLRLLDRLRVANITKS